MSDRAIETLLDEERRFPPDPAFAAQANAQPEIYDIDPDAFWEREGRPKSGEQAPSVHEVLTMHAATRAHERRPAVEGEPAKDDTASNL